MRELSGSAATNIDAEPARCLEVLRAVDRYPEWFGERIREVTVVERGSDELPSVVRATLRVQIGPFAQDVHLLLRITADESGVTLARIAHEPADPEEFLVRWEIGASRLSVEITARLDVPRLVPIGGVGDAIAGDFVQAAARAVAEERR